MRTYDLKGVDGREATRWTLTETEKGEKPEKIGTLDGFTATEAKEWADREVGPYVELDWKPMGPDKSVFARQWRAWQADPWDED